MLIGMAIQAKRIVNGTFSQGNFTRYLESVQYKSREEIRHLQAIELSKLLKHAVDNVPYYESLKGELALTNESVFSDVNCFPIVAKEILSKEKNKFLAPGIPDVKSMYSGGTTMTRVSVNTGKYFETHKANEYFNRVSGIYPGMSRFILARHEDTYVEGGPKFEEIDFKVNRFSRTYHISPLESNLVRYPDVVLALNLATPKIFKGNSAMLYEFARSIEKNGWETIKVPIAFCGNTTMKDEYIKTLGRVFSSRVYDAYGATETGIVAAQCEKSEGLHYIPILHYLETLKGSKPVGCGEVGSLTITSLAHYAMPIIRYQIGDLVILSDKNCSCGRSYPMIESIKGRTHEVINSSVGAVVSVYEIMGLTGNIPEIMDFQVIEISPDNIIMKLKCPDGPLDSDTINKLKIDIIELMGCETRIDINYVGKMPRLPSGKILRVVPLGMNGGE